MNFIDFARAHGVEITALDSSGRLRRCGTVEHPRSDNGAYKWDGQRGWVQAWDGDGEVHWFDDPTAKPWTASEKRQWAEQRDAQRRMLEEGYAEAERTAESMLHTCKIGTSAYLTSKGLADVPALLLPDGALFVPMRSLYGVMQGAQVIRWKPDVRKHEKKMLFRMRAKGSVHRIGDRKAPTTILCEGYATGLSIKAAIQQAHLSASVLVCFSDSNLVHVASMVSGTRIVFADNDASGAGERAAKATGLRYCMAPTVGWDANDWHYADGLMPVRAAIVNAMREAVAA